MPQDAKHGVQDAVALDRVAGTGLGVNVDVGPAQSTAPKRFRQRVGTG